MTYTADVRSTGRASFDVSAPAGPNRPEIRVVDEHGHHARSVNAPADRAPQLTVVVPTRNEMENVGPLLDGLSAALSQLSIEIIFVDDSDDATPGVIASCASECPVPVRLLHRPAGARTAGLSGAVIEGFRQARGVWVLVMDGDLQHPSEVAATLAQTALRHDVDLVVGTRYAGSGSGSGLNGAPRQLSSSLATRLTKAAFPRRLATVSDPMSGLFLFRRAAVDVDRLNPIGFKILLETLIRHPGLRVAEVAYQFGPRHAGTSKASVREGVAFSRHLARLRLAVLRRQLRERPTSRRERLLHVARAVAFGLVGLSGVAVNTWVLWLFFHAVGLHEVIAATLATQASTAWNFLLVDLLVYRGPKRGRRAARAGRFFLMNNLLLLGRLPILELLVWLGLGVLVGNAVTLVLLFLVRFLVSDRVIYGSPTAKPAKESTRDPVRVLVDTAAAPARSSHSARKRSRYLPYRYDIAGVVTIGSQIPLPELEFFRAQWVADGDVDMAVRTGDVGRRSPRRRAALTEYADPVALHYEEHLGRLGANFRVELGHPIDIQVGPLLSRSPHVVYTNIIEALLRFVMVSRDHMLLHSACLSLDGVGIMLSALTDTGKTATVLRLLREHGGRFLSDDMTVVDANGNAICFPKPLTISAHTLRAVNANDLTPAEWRRLQLQSRLHSKSGRSLALTLAKLNLPIMGVNALTQMLIPPPKYTVDRLVPCRMGSTTRVQELFVIERGRPGIRDLDRATTLERMLANTDDAYGFPPFRYLAPTIRIDGQDYTELRAKERNILAGFLSHVRTRVIASDTFGWADEIPKLLGTPTPESAPPNGRAHPIVLPHPAGDAESWPRWNTRLALDGGLS